MKKNLLVLFLFKVLVILPQSKITTLQELKLDSSKNYISVKQKIKAKRNSLKKTDKSLSLAFKTSLVNSIIPFWEGTKWTFEGHTKTPKKGTIACGYFVSTTLKDVGLNLNRYKLAQQLPINEAKSLALNSEVKIVSEGSVQKNIVAINKCTKEGIYFIGFDQSHVGFLLKEKGSLYLIHSNYLDLEGVVIEQIEQSEVFLGYELFYLVPLSTNQKLLEYWVTKKPIKIVLK